ncbi:MAG: right-handed parallel beta-helix repeat-containing protein [Verrucomicrobiales bacterium]|nr:right-handed parallel beta-helix repeat-containing protein [Verrucomicrobiales bacterium]
MRLRLLPLILVSFSTLLHAEDAAPSASDQRPDLASLPDQTEALQKQINETGSLLLPAGTHRITKPLVFPLSQKRSTAVRPGAGAVTLIMDGPGPAIRIIGSHKGTASPKSFEAATWNENMPIIEGIDIVGNHPQANGIELFQTVGAIVNKVSVRWCHHGIHLVERNRNVVISDVHLYENSGIGLYLDDLSLHQINVSNSHISYNRTGGIVVRDGNVRNLQITGCDIEGNMPADDTHTNAANIMIDVSASPGDRSKSVAEVAITGCTIQHSSNYSGSQYDSIAPGGANIRILGKEIWPVDSVTITGNVISDTNVHLDMSYATDVTVTGNTFFAPNPDFVHVRDSKRILLNGNTFNPRQFERPGRLVFERCQDSILSNCTFRALQAEDGVIVIRDSIRINLNSNILTESKSGVRTERSEQIQVENWIVSGLPDGKKLLESR